MWTEIQDSITGYLPAKRKTTSSGWISFNSPCCHHNGESPDTRGRGGLIFNGQGAVNYHCFNCGFKASYTPGRQINFKFKKLLGWVGVDDRTISRLVIEALRIKNLISPEDIVEKPAVEINIKSRPLPRSAGSFNEWITALQLQDDNEAINTHLHDAFNYVLDRKIDIQRYTFYWTDEQAYNLHKRVIIPIEWKGRGMGYIARATSEEVKPKYHNSFEPGNVFNLDKQLPNNKIAIVVEGPFDAMAIDGVAVLGAEVSEVQAELIEDLDKKIIVVADADKAGQQLINAAIKYGWSVSFPAWQKDFKDVSEAVENLGKLFVLKSIVDAVEDNPLKIQLRRKINA